MAKFVIKKDGSKEPFDEEKIKGSIRAAAQGANVSGDRINELVQQVGGAAIAMANAKEEIATSEIKTKILNDLDGLEPSISAAWRQHDEQKAGV